MFGGFGGGVRGGVWGGRGGAPVEVQNKGNMEEENFSALETYMAGWSKGDMKMVSGILVRSCWC